MEMIQAVKSLTALAQESRLRVFRLVVRAGTEGVAAGRIAQELEISPATLSFHLKELTNAGLLRDRKDGRWVFYSPNEEGIRSLISFLVEDCCQGHPELCETLCQQSEPKRTKSNRKRAAAKGRR